MARWAAGRRRDKRRRWRDNAADRPRNSQSSAWSTSRPRARRLRARCWAQAIPATASWRGGDALPPCRRPRRARRPSRGRADCGRPSPAPRGRDRKPYRRRSADSPPRAGSRARTCRSRSPRNGSRARGRAPSPRRRRDRSSRAPAPRARTWSRPRRRYSRRPPRARRRRSRPPFAIARRRCRLWTPRPACGSAGRC